LWCCHHSPPHNHSPLKHHLKNNNTKTHTQEDLILPHHHTFYELIANKARGKSGPLFDFGVTDDIRILNDASVEKADAHAGKVVDRHWYERNRHIFPASRWEPYDPDKVWETYTVHGGEVQQGR
jgi:protein FAM50